MEPERPLFYCRMCEEWSIQSCGRAGHDEHVESPDPMVALLNYLDAITAAILKLDKE